MMDGKTVKVRYLLSKEGQKDSLRKGGNGKEVQEVEFPLTEMWLALAKVDYAGTASVNLAPPDLTVYTWTVEETEYMDESIPGAQAVPMDVVHVEWHDDDESGVLFNRVPQEVELKVLAHRQADANASKQALRQAEKDIEARQRDQRSAYDRFCKVNAEVIAEHNAKMRAEEEQRQREEYERQAAFMAKAEAARAAWDVRKAKWIERHGSERLKLAHIHKYDTDQLYVDERLARELPGYQADHDAEVTEARRNHPSLEALRELDRVLDTLVEAAAPSYFCDAEIVWLQNGLSALGGSAEGCEAVRIRFGGTDCYKVIEEEW